MSARRRRTAAGAAGVAALAAAGVALAAAGDGTGRTAGTAPVRTATASVERGTLTDRETVAGTLGYAGQGPLGAAAAGVLTRPPREGAVVRRGHALYELAGQKTGWVLYGSRPAWRTLQPGADGADVRQLERNLQALGYAPGTADGEWTSATTAAVVAFQDDRGLIEDGTLDAGEVVFWPGPARVGAVEAERGEQVAPGRPIATLTTRERVVTVDLEADRQDLARRGDAVTVGLPDGTRARGRITAVAAVATAAADESSEPTIAVTIALQGKAARGTRLDQAPVEVGLVRQRARRVLSVPLSAILAQPQGGYAVEVVDRGSTRRVPVELGLVADGSVAITGAVREGDRVVVPA